MDGLWAAVPSSAESVNRWVGAAILLYLIAAYAFRAIRTRKLIVEIPPLIVALFGGVSAGTGSLMFLSLFRPSLLAVLLSDQSMYVGVAGGAAVVASLHGLTGRMPPKVCPVPAEPCPHAS